MSLIKQNLITKALAAHSRIFPVSGLESLEDCFTIEKNRVLFWFNTADNSTHVLVASGL